MFGKNWKYISDNGRVGTGDWPGDNDGNWNSGVEQWVSSDDRVYFYSRFLLHYAGRCVTTCNPSTFSPVEKRQTYNDDWVIKQMHAVIIL